MPMRPVNGDALAMSRDGHTIVCAVDGSAGSPELVRIAARLAELVGARVEVVHVLGAAPSGTPHQGELRAGAMLRDLCATAGAPAAATHVVRYGDPARRVARMAEHLGALLIVVGARADRRDGDRLIGSVSSRLAADASCPVLVVPPGLERHVRPSAWRGRTLVCGFDGSLPSWGAARHTAALAGLLGGSLSVVSVGTRVRSADVVRGLNGNCGLPALDVRYEHRAGDPVWELERVAAAITAPLIAIGSRGLGPWEDALLGSVARRLLQTARRPTLILPAASLLDQRAS